MASFDQSISGLKSKLARIAEATRALSGSTRKMSLDEIPNIILQNSGTFCYYLGQGTSFNIKALYPTQYMNFTADNFIVAIDKINQPHLSFTSGGSQSGGITKTYNSNTGDFHVSMSSATNTIRNTFKVDYNSSLSSDFTVSATASCDISIKVYIVSSVRTSGEANYCNYLGTFDGNGQINIRALYPNTYQTFNVNDFIVCTSTLSGAGDGGYHFNSVTEGGNYNMSTSTPTLIYNNGILQISGTSISGSFNSGTPGPYGGGWARLSGIKAYLVSNKYTPNLVYDLGTIGGFQYSAGSAVIDISSKIPTYDYRLLTINNFILQVTSRGCHWTATDWVGVTHNYVPTMSYNSNTGKLTVNYSFAITCNDYTGYVGYGCHLYCCIGKQ